jgi:acyl dehydratase
MKGFSAVEYFKLMGRLAAREWRSREPVRRLPTTRVAAERRGLRVNPKRLSAYLAATGMDGRRVDPDGPLPPLYPALWETLLVLELLGHPEMPSARGGVVHLENELVQVRPVVAAEPVRCRVELERAEPDARGARLRLLTRTWNEAGQLGSEGRSVMLVRGPGFSVREEERAEDGEAEERWEEVTRWRLRGSHGRRYARASGDYNPIHLSRLTALPFGFRRPILHGFCIEALAVNALLGERCGGDPAAFGGVRIRFRRPLLLPATAVLRAVADGNRLRFQVEDGQDRVCAEGELTTRT